MNGHRTGRRSIFGHPFFRSPMFPFGFYGLLVIIAVVLWLTLPGFLYHKRAYVSVTTRPSAAETQTGHEGLLEIRKASTASPSGAAQLVHATERRPTEAELRRMIGKSVLEILAATALAVEFPSTGSEEGIIRIDGKFTGEAFCRDRQGRSYVLRFDQGTLMGVGKREQEDHAAEREE